MPTTPDDPTPDNPSSDISPEHDGSPEHGQERRPLTREQWLAQSREHREAAERQWVEAVAADPRLQQQLRDAAAHLSDHLLPGLRAVTAEPADFAARYAEVIAPTLRRLDAVITAFLGPLPKTVGATPQGLLPANLVPARDVVSASEVLVFVRDHGIPMWAVPRADLAVDLLRAAPPDGAWEVLDVHAAAFLDDCAAALDGCTDPTWADLAGYARRAVTAAQAGHTEAAQALAASVLETVWIRYVPDTGERGRLQRPDPDPDQPPPSATASAPQIFDVDAVAMLYALPPAGRAYASFWAHRGDPIPTVFTRHASAHGVSARQYTRANCVQGCLIVVSMLAFLQGRLPLPAPPPEVREKRRRRRRRAKPGSSPTR